MEDWSAAFNKTAWRFFAFLGYRSVEKAFLVKMASKFDTSRWNATRLARSAHVNPGKNLNAVVEMGDVLSALRGAGLCEAVRNCSAALGYDVAFDCTLTKDVEATHDRYQPAPRKGSTP